MRDFQLSDHLDRTVGGLPALARWEPARERPPLHLSFCCACDTGSGSMAYFERRRAEGLTNRDVTRWLKRHVANEVYAALLNPATDNPVGRELGVRPQAIGVPINVLATSLGIPYQRLRRLEIGVRADPKLEQRANRALTQLEPRRLLGDTTGSQPNSDLGMNVPR